MKSTILKILAVLMLAFSSFASAEAPTMGAEFDAVAQNISTDNPAKIEVMEIFWSEQTPASLIRSIYPVAQQIHVIMQCIQSSILPAVIRGSNFR